MRRFFVLMIVLTLLLTGCNNNASEVAVSQEPSKEVTPTATIEVSKPLVSTPEVAEESKKPESSGSIYSSEPYTFNLNGYRFMIPGYFKFDSSEDDDKCHFTDRNDATLFLATAINEDIINSTAEEIFELIEESMINSLVEYENYSMFRCYINDFLCIILDAHNEDLYGLAYIGFDSSTGTLILAVIEYENTREQDYTHDYLDMLLSIKSNNFTSDRPATSTRPQINLSGIRPEFKAAMDAYEEFYSEYCEYLKLYMENPTDMKIFTRYMELVDQAEEMSEAFEKWTDEDLTNEETKYYLEVNSRIMQMLVDFAD